MRASFEEFSKQKHACQSNFCSFCLNLLTKRLTDCCNCDIVNRMANRKKLLIISDAVSSNTGFGRIARDLSVRINANLSDVYELATAGFGSPGSNKYPWQQYYLEGVKDWVIPTLPQICDDFFGGEEGIVWFIWDLSRLTWFSQPMMFRELTDGYPGLQEWLLKQKFQKWIYLPVDGSGPNDKFTFPLMRALYGFDRILAYTQFGEDVVRRSIGDMDADARHLTNLPHGIDSEVFYETNRKRCRRLLFQYTGASTGKMMRGASRIPDPIKDNECLIGIFCTNQSRKDWHLGIQVASLIAKERPIRLLCHTDGLERAWSIPSLLADYGILDQAIISTGTIGDDKMAQAYSSCDLTLAIGLGEGMGFPIFESMFCGTPVLHGDYAGAPEYLAERSYGKRIPSDNEPFLVKPIGFHAEGCYSFKRPVFDPEDWAKKATSLIGKRVNHCGELDWNVLWQRWEIYLRKAAQ